MLDKTILTKYIGRDYAKYNCFDLVKEFYMDFYFLDLRYYFEGKIVPERKEIESLVVTNRGDFLKVDSPEFGDLVFINLYGYTSHIGVCVGKGKFLHSMKKVGSCCDSLARYSKMIDGFYRHRERAQ